MLKLDESEIRMRREIFIHLPLPYYNGDQLIRSLLSNKGAYTSFGLNLPEPEIYRRRLSKFLTAPEDSVMSGVASEAMLKELGVAHRKRTVISLPGVPNKPHEIVNENGLIPGLNNVVRRMQSFFKDFEITLLIGVVNPGHLLATLYQANAGKDVLNVKRIVESERFWSDALGACIDEFPQVKVLAWQHEFATIVWPMILRTVGLVPTSRFAPGSLDMAKHIISRGGVDKIADFLRESSIKDDKGIVTSVKLFLNQLSDKNEQTRQIRIPGWSDDLMQAFNRVYEEDLRMLSRESGVIFLDYRSSNLYSPNARVGG